MFLCVFIHTQGHTDMFVCKYLITCTSPNPQVPYCLESYIGEN